jgi:sulfite exporter TauE/SafE
MNTILFSAFVLGLTSNLHCIVMCGPIALAIPMNRSSNWTILVGSLQYNLGRISTYSILGILVGSIGLSINAFGALQIISVVSGFGLIFFAWRNWWTKYLSFGKNILSFSPFLSRGMGKLIKSDIPAKPFFFGFINGFLPCGMVYVALLNALLAGNIWFSMYSMAIFGAGTLPVMLFVSYAAHKISGSHRKLIRVWIPYLLTLVGLLIVLRGLDLNIPYISPKVEMTKNSLTDKEQIEMTCCHAAKKCD